MATTQKPKTSRKKKADPVDETSSEITGIQFAKIEGSSLWVNSAQGIHYEMNV